MLDYRRPPLPDLVFRDARGQVIPYGQRWADRDWDGPEETYSVTAHPERFAPFVEVARAIVEHLVATYDVRREDSPGPGGSSSVRLVPAEPTAAPLLFVFDPSPRVRVTAGLRSSIAWFCECDHCDEDVLVAIDTLEQEISAVVSGGLREWLNDPAAGYVGDDLFLADSLTSPDGEIDGGGSSSVDDPARREALRAEYATVPPQWTAWPLRRR
jgi:hypothetical protein